ncbi:MAG: thioesterase domain-containing protein, partial [Sedimenticola sp.]|nr:thioesterase domain-containing protein [Sedimenticola sp.]
QVGVNDDFFQLGGDSLRGALCTYQLQNAMHETIPITAIFEAPTISEFAVYLEQRHPAGVAHLLGTPIPISVPIAEDKHPTPIVPIQSKGDKPPLFCIHPAGGIVFPYYALASYLGEDQPVYGVQDPGIYDPRPVLTSIEAMAACYLEAMKTIQPEGPYYLLGWSVGGLVAYEMAQQLFMQGQRVAALIMLDTSAPVLTKIAHSPAFSKDRLLRFMSWVKGLLNGIQDIRSAIEPIASYIRGSLFLLSIYRKLNTTEPTDKLTTGDLLAWTGLDTWRSHLLGVEKGGGSKGFQNARLLLVEMPLVRRILKLIRKHGRLVYRYTAKSYPGQITLFRAEHPGTNQKTLVNPTMGWGILAEDGVEVHTIQANHVALLAKPYIELLAQELNTCLKRSV